MPRNRASYPVQWLAGLGSMFMPLVTRHDPARIVLTSFHGDGYRGNTRVLFEALCGHPVFRPVWLSRSPKLVQKLKDRHGEQRAFLMHSARGLKMLAGAGAVFMTHGTSDYAFMRLPRRALRIQSYHGLPTKRGEYLRREGDQRPNPLHRLILAYRFRPITHFISSSPFVSRIYAARFNLPAEALLETGYPAYDALCNKADAPDRKTEAIARIWPGAPSAGRIILYAPTFRRRSKTRFFPFDDADMDRINHFLEEHNALIAIRAHPNDGKAAGAIYRKYKRLVLAGHDHIEDVNRLLMLADAIVTDYSGIYLEGLLRDIPCIFLPYDLESYERGFPYAYSDHTPGPKPGNQSAFLDCLARALSGDDGYSSRRAAIRELFFSTTDGRATERVLSFLEETLLNRS